MKIILWRKINEKKKKKERNYEIALLYASLFELIFKHSQQYSMLILIQHLVGWPKRKVCLRK